VKPFETQRRDATPACPTRWKDPRVWRAWLLLAACIGLVLWLGGPGFSANSTSRYLRPLLLFFFPDLGPRELWNAQVFVRKLAHVTEYAVLALLAFRTFWLSFHTILARLAAGALLTALCVAAIDESRQVFTGTRTGSPHDVLLDLAGALAAVGMAIAYLRWKRGGAAEAPGAQRESLPANHEESPS